LVEYVKRRDGSGIGTCGRTFAINTHLSPLLSECFHAPIYNFCDCPNQDKKNVGLSWVDLGELVGVLKGSCG